MIKKELTKSETKEKALRLLAFRAHSEKELLEKLKRAGAKTEDLPPVVEFLKEYGFLNDAEYAVHLAKDLQNIKKYGKRRIVAELKSKGINAAYIDAAISELSEEEEDTLLPLVRRKLGGNFEKKNIDKAIRYFIYRGYEFDDIKSCVEKLEQETE
ncbi:MAG TPA: hypothetical protein DCO93_00130 [Clostridiales bacterium]|nr:hypothetical protein [Clostridiales bacterium]